MEVAAERSEARPRAKVQWQNHSKKMREKWNLDETVKPWSSTMNGKHYFRGLSNTPRNIDMLDLGYLWKNESITKSASRKRHRWAPKKEIIKGLFCNTTPEPGRSPFGEIGSISSSTSLYSFEEDRVVVPAEYFRFLGYDLDMIASRLMTKQHQGLAGEAIHLPSLAVIMISMLAVVQFPGLWASPEDGCSELDFRLGLLNRIPMQVQENVQENSQDNDVLEEEFWNGLEALSTE